MAEEEPFPPGKLRQEEAQGGRNSVAAKPLQVSRAGWGRRPCSGDGMGWDGL